MTDRPTIPARLMGGVCALALTAGLAAGTAGAQEPVKLGALMPMTGDLAAFGETCYNGVQLAVDQINGAGGLLGADIELVLGDTQTLPQPAIDAAQRMANVDGVAGIIGALSSGNTIPVAQTVAAAEGVPMMSPASTSPVITGLEDDGYLFRTVPSDAFQGVALADVTMDHDIDTVAVIYVNNDYGEGLANSFGGAFEERGGTITGSVPYEQGRASYRGELQQLAGDAQALVLIGYPENGATILRQALEEGFFDRFIFTDGMKAPEIIEQIGAEFLNGSFGTAPQALPESATAEAFAEFYNEAYGELPPKPYIDTSYDAAMLMALAIEAAGSTDGAAIRDALSMVANAPGEPIRPGEWEKAVGILADGGDIDYVGASGSLDFDDVGDVGGTFAHWAIQDGEITTINVFEP
ncbi:MAG: ABC transporter substrate-binding protein [Deinococcus-Thermus bacterium]|jgi:ABC-type branched-subunit amino acid transport system substrate-binding protein|nr:ABC transporter substrate-binding protein [Deinococcota bacterium]